MDNIDEEGHFYHTLATLKDLIDQYGVETVVEGLDDETYVAIFDYFVPPIEDGDDGYDQDD